METAQELIGRREELGALAELIDEGSVRGATLVVCGDAGIGKSALLQAARGTARARGFRVLTSVGVQSEAQLPFAGLHQVLRPVQGTISDLPPVQRDALLSAFGLSDGPAPEPFLISLAAASVLAAVAAERPVALLADDVQWLDPLSQEALTFLGHRAAGNPIVVVGVVRNGFPSPFLSAGFPRFDIGGVDDAAAERILLAHAGDLSAGDRRLIQHEALGNPLALMELPAVWRGAEAPTTDLQHLTLSARLERAFAGRITELPPGTRDAVLVAAASGCSCHRGRSAPTCTASSPNSTSPPGRNSPPASTTRSDN
jgi:predicted ATPase